MRFQETKIFGVYIVDIDRLTDERGFFARTWDTHEAEKFGISLSSAQCNVSFNARTGTLRGMHYQEEPRGESKLVRCTQGAIWDVALDLRPLSPSFCSWIAVELSADNRRMLYIPAGCAHGFQTLADNTEVFYQMGEYFHSESARGVRFDDPAFSIEWPSVTDRIISEKDRSYPDWQL